MVKTFGVCVRVCVYDDGIVYVIIYYTVSVTEIRPTWSGKQTVAARRSLPRHLPPV